MKPAAPCSTGGATISATDVFDRFENFSQPTPIAAFMTKVALLVCHSGPFPRRILQEVRAVVRIFSTVGSQLLTICCFNCLMGIICHRSGPRSRTAARNRPPKLSQFHLIAMCFNHPKEAKHQCTEKPLFSVFSSRTKPGKLKSCARFTCQV